MISYLHGKIVIKELDFIVIDVNGVGYGVNVPTSLIGKLPGINEEATIYTYLYVREDNMSLYGFESRDSLALFKLLIGVNGIGPKGALAVLSTLTPDELRFAVLSDDAKAIAKAPGIGQKTAVKAILELKDKMNLADAFETKLENNSESASGDQNEIKDAVMALNSLGYTNSQALKAVNSVSVTPGMKSDDILKEALKAIVKMGF